MPFGTTNVPEAATPAELHQVYLVDQARFEGARQMAWLLSDNGHLSPNAREEMEKQVNTLKERAAASHQAFTEATRKPHTLAAAA